MLVSNWQSKGLVLGLGLNLKFTLLYFLFLFSRRLFFEKLVLYSNLEQFENFFLFLFLQIRKSERGFCHCTKQFNKQSGAAQCGQ